MSQIIKLSFEELSKKYPKLRVSDIERLREWREKEPHLPEICDNSLALFLHKNNYHVESTKINIDHYYTLRTHMPEFFTNRDPVSNESFRKFFDVMCILPLQHVTKEGNKIMLVKLINRDGSKFYCNDYIKYILLTVDLSVYLSKSFDGYAFIFDTQDITLEHAARLNPFSMKNCAYISRQETLKKFVSLEGLPNELGGKGGPLIDLHRAHIKEFETHRDWILELELRNQVDDTKRPGKGKRAEDLFGVEGSFNKLDIE